MIELINPITKEIYPVFESLDTLQLLYTEPILERGIIQFKCGDRIYLAVTLKKAEDLWQTLKYQCELMRSLPPNNDEV